MCRIRSGGRELGVRPAVVKIEHSDSAGRDLDERLVFRGAVVENKIDARSRLAVFKTDRSRA